MLPLPTADNQTEVQFQSPQRRAYIRTKKYLTTEEAAATRRFAATTPRRNAPPWAFSDVKLQRVVAELLWKAVKVCGTATFPEATFESNKIMFVQALDARLRAKKFKPLKTSVEQKIRERESWLAHDKFGRSALFVAIIYLAYRNGMKSPAIAETVCNGDGSISPPFVRQVLAKANIIARSLWPDECFELHHTADTRKYMQRLDTIQKRRLKKGPLPSGLELNKLFEAGEHPRAIAKRFGVYLGFVMHCINQHRELSGLAPVNPKTFRVIVVGPKPRSGRRPKYDPNHFRELYEVGKTPREIRALTGASLQFIQWTLWKKFGVNTGRDWTSVIAYNEKHRAASRHRNAPSY
jgi:hypothetical protein